MNYKNFRKTKKDILTPLEDLYIEIAYLKKGAIELNLETDAKVLDGVENLIYERMNKGEEFKIFVNFGMSLLVSNIGEENLNNQILENVFNRSTDCFNELFNVKGLYKNEKFKNLKKDEQ